MKGGRRAMRRSVKLLVTAAVLLIFSEVIVIASMALLPQISALARAGLLAVCWLVIGALLWRVLPDAAG